MSRDGVSGCVGGGCGGLSLIGLLVGVGLTMWLGSIAMNGGFGSNKDKSGDEKASVSSVLATTTTLAPTAPITVSPTTDLTDGATVTVRSSAFPAGSKVRVTTCLARATLATGDAALCDDTTGSTGATDASGHLNVPYRVPRVVTVGGTPFDCAEKPESCVVTATSVDRPALHGAVPVTFAPQAHGPEITLPD